nr:VanZ family protein [Anaeroplasmataceae bacterium]
VLVIIVVWMGVIFYFSHQNGSSSTKMSNSITNWVAKEFVPGFSNKSKTEQIKILKNTSYVIRKLAHYFEFAILGLFSLILAKLFLHKDKFIYPAAILLSILYALTDELHQYFIKGRTPMIQDVIIDSLGAITMILFAGSIINLYRIIKKGKKYD